MSTMMQITQSRTPVTAMQSRTGGFVPVPKGSGGPKETVWSHWALTSASRFSPAIHRSPSESSLSVQRPPLDASASFMHVMHPRMLALVPWALVTKAEPVASISKVKAPTVSKIHTACQWAITRFSNLVPFDTNEWDQPLVNNIHVVPHYWDIND